MPERLPSEAGRREAPRGPWGVAPPAAAAAAAAGCRLACVSVDGNVTNLLGRWCSWDWLTWEGRTAPICSPDEVRCSALGSLDSPVQTKSDFITQEFNAEGAASMLQQLHASFCQLCSTPDSIAELHNQCVHIHSTSQHYWTKIRLIILCHQNCECILEI